MRLRIKNYLFAGLDFMFDQDGKPWFIEANSIPAFMHILVKLYGQAMPIKEISKMLVSRGGSVFFIFPKVNKFHWLINEYKKYLDGLDVHIISNNNVRAGKYLKFGEKMIKPDSILRYCYRLPRSFERSGALVINPMCVTDVTLDKIKTFDAIRRHSKTKLNIPQTYTIHSNKDLETILKKESEIFKNGFVIKPLRGSFGRGVKVFSKNEHLPKVRSKNILQRRIIANLRDGKYWDIRIFVTNCKVFTGYIRESSNMVTNISQGARACKLPNKLLKKLIKPSTAIVKAIDKEAERIKYTV